MLVPKMKPIVRAENTFVGRWDGDGAKCSPQCAAHLSAALLFVAAELEEIVHGVASGLISDSAGLRITQFWSDMRQIEGITEESRRHFPII